MANEQGQSAQRRPARPRGFGPGGHMQGVEKAKDFQGTIKKLMQHMSQYRMQLFAVAICAILSTVFNIIGPTVLGQATTTIYTGLVAKISGTGGIDFAAIGQLLLTLLLLYGISAAFSFIQGVLMTGVSNRVTYRIRRDISAKINRLPLKYFESRTYGETLSRVTNDVDTMGQGLNQSLTQLVTSVATIIGVFVMMLRINVWMTLAVLLILPLSVGIIGMVMKRSQKYFRAQQSTLAKINGQVEEVYGGLNIVKAFNRQDDMAKTFDAVNDQLYDSAWRSQTFSGVMMPVMQFIGNLGYVVVAILGGYLTITGAIMVGEIQAFIQYVRNFTQPIQQIAQVTNMMQSMAAAAERAFEFLDEEEEQQQLENPAPVQNIQGNVEFSHVRFGYNPDQPVIHDFSAGIQKGQKVAIVGPTGAGKTTIVKLLMRFYDVDGGSIAVDGHDLRSFERNDLRQVFGMVLQDTWLFNGTVMENIRYGRLDATDEEVMQAAKAAHVHHFILTQPDGYNMTINEETTNLSQGQRQLLTIARAILADNRILILDEATSSVDTRTEQLIQRAMDNLMQGRTSFVIAHRLSTIKNADRILVINDGDIIEQGTHQELLEKQGFYADLYQSQFEAARV